MIFVTVGTQLPFDRLISWVDQWAEQNKDVPIFGQIGSSTYRPNNFEYSFDLTPEEYDSYFNQSDFIVSHAGMGTIISSLLDSKPIIVLPRDSDLGEHRNQHQKSTCERFSHLSGFYVCHSNEEIHNFLDKRHTLSSGGINQNNNQLMLHLESAIEGFIS
jgi:UDP-N-acetylglucosamine transferase subunit ALG13